MLWVSILALFGALVAAYGINLPAKLKANALNPFRSIANAPFEGRDCSIISLKRF